MARILSALFVMVLGLALATPAAAQNNDTPAPEPPAETADEDPQPQPQPQPEPEPLPEMPQAPVVREDVPAIEANLEDSRQRREAAVEELNRAAAALNEARDDPETTEERLAELKAVVEQLEARVEALAEEIERRTALLEAARVGPTRAQLTARREYDELVARAERVARDLVIGARQEDGEVEGAYARRIREAEEELARIHQLSMRYENFDFSGSRVYQRLSEIERLEYEMRWADQRYELALREYELLRDEVFVAYREYEQRAHVGMRALERARTELWPQFANTPAAALELPGLPLPPTSRDTEAPTVTRMMQNIENRLRRRSGTAPGEHPLTIRKLQGRLQQAQVRISDRQDFRETLAREAERLKDIIAQTDAAEAEREVRPSRIEMEEYQRLGLDIQELEDELRRLRYQLDRMGAERAAREASLADRLRDQRAAETEAEEYRQRENELNERWDDGSESWRAMSQFERRLKPHILLFIVGEGLAAREERLNSARRERRQVESEMDLEERRAERLQARISEIESTLLPELETRYYRAIATTIGVRAIKVIGVLLVAWLLLWLIKFGGSPLIERIVRRADGKDEFSADAQQRTRTLMTVFMTTAKVVVWITAIMFAIAQFDVDYGPLLVAAGGVSLAVGFGAQTLVRDFFAGFFILLEGQFSIGDVVDLNGKIGTVENLNLRTTVLRSLDGSVHTVPNGEITRTTNMTKQWSRAVVDIGVAYEENTDDIAAIMEAVASEMREDEAWGHKLIEWFMSGLQELGDSGVTMRILLKSRAGEQWGVAREYRRRVKLKFDELGVEIPWPQRVVSYKSYADQDEKTRSNAERGKKARILRYTRRARGEITEEEAALANMSIEERDRAQSLANAKTERAMASAEASGEDAVDVARGKRETAEEQGELSDAERLAHQLAKKQIKERTRMLTPEELKERNIDPELLDETDKAPPETPEEDKKQPDEDEEQSDDKSKPS
jgi:moderate conductance mechanosensitive channel